MTLLYHVTPSSHVLSLLSRVKLLPLATLRKALESVDCSGCNEKSEYQRMLIARLVFAEKISMARRATPRTIQLPPWSTSLGEWKV